MRRAGDVHRSLDAAGSLQGYHPIIKQLIECGSGGQIGVHLQSVVNNLQACCQTLNEHLAGYLLCPPAVLPDVQRIRSAEEIFVSRHGNCLDYSVLTASLLEALVLERKLRHGGNPALSAQAAAVTVETNVYEDMRPVKKKSNGRIDGIVALIFALGWWEQEQIVNKAIGNAFEWVDLDLWTPYVCIIAVMGVGTHGGALDSLPFVILETCVVLVLGVATFTGSRDFMWAASVAVSVVAVGKIAFLRLGAPTQSATLTKKEAKPEPEPEPKTAPAAPAETDPPAA